MPIKDRSMQHVDDAIYGLIKEGVNPVLARLYAARGIGKRHEIEAGISDLLPASKMKNLDRMADALAKAVIDGKSMRILADYDVDGATSCAILMRGLRSVGAKIEYTVPDRMIHGYGLTPSIVAEVVRNRETSDILITVDNGISSIAGVKAANDAGMRVLVTDHHLPGAELPEAECIVNPNQPGCDFPSKSIAGCGVAWYLIDCLRQRHFPLLDSDSLLPLVAVGTVADVVKLDFNNRILVRSGLQMIRSGQAQEGIRALVEVSSKCMETLSVTDIGFSIGPRINAAGRLESMRAGIDCLISDSRRETLAFARQLNDINVRRKEIHEEMVEQALTDIVANGDNHEGNTIVAFREQWHEGVIGIVAGRLKESFGKPVFALTRTESGNIKGSGRSIPEIHLKHALDRVAQYVPDAIVTYGGHAMAAGVTLAPGGLEKFKKAFAEAVLEQLPDGLPEQALVTDGPLQMDEMTKEVAEAICLDVWGSGFPEPVFRDRFLVEDMKRMGDGRHARLTVSKEDAAATAVWFDCPEWIAVGSVLDCAYRLSINTWKGVSSIQMMVDQNTTQAPRPSCGHQSLRHN